MKYIKTTWKLATYDVWGNPQDGYEVNDVYGKGSVEIACAVERFNVGTPQEFEAASPSNRQIRQAFGLGRVHLKLGGDDMQITVNRARDGYPIGEMTCTSHSSLSPIREKVV